MIEDVLMSVKDSIDVVFDHMKYIVSMFDRERLVTFCTFWRISVFNKIRSNVLNKYVQCIIGYI